MSIIDKNPLNFNSNGDNPFKQFALKYAEKGLPVVPLHYRSKRPRAERWQERATTDPETINAIWEQDGELNIGIKLGRGSFIDLECDTDEAETEYQALWGGNPPHVPTFKGKRGKHRLFRWREGFPNKAVFHAGAIEVRLGNDDKGAQSVFPPSIHPDGETRYQWVVSLDEAQPGEIPDEILRKLLTAAKPQETVEKKSDRVKSVDVEDDDLPPVEERVESFNRKLAKTPGAQQSKGAGADPYCFGVAVEAVWGFALPEDEAIDCLYDWGQREDQLDNDGNHYPWSYAEIRHKVQDALNVDYDGSKGDKLADYQLRKDEAKVERIVAAATIQEKTTGDEFEGCKTFDQPEEAALYEASKTAKKRGEKKQPAFTTLYSPSELMKLDLKPRFLVKGIMVAGQPLVIGGRSKTMKTSLTCDLVVSLASGSSFLGTFPTVKQIVGFWSGESGGAVIRETMLRICKTRGVRFEDCSLFQSFGIPKLSVEEHLKLLAGIIQEKKITVAIVDPLYLSLLAGNSGGKSSDLFFMGSMLQPLTELGQALGCTFATLHHFRKTGIQSNEEPAGLEELAQSGIAEWARQWILLQRRQPYQLDGNHSLWMRAGGSAGHAGLWGVDIDEGLLDPETFEGRKWKVKVISQSKVIEETREKKETERLLNEQKRRDEKEQKIIAVLQMYPKGESEYGLRQSTGIEAKVLLPLLVGMESAGILERCEVIKKTWKGDGWRLITIV